MGVDLEKKRKLLLYPREYQRGCPMRVGFGICKDCGDAGRLGMGRAGTTTF